MRPPLWIDVARLDYLDALAALTAALKGKRVLVPRQIVDTTGGQILLMPAELPPFAGVKVVTIAPANDERGLPRIHGVYTLFDSATLVPLAQFDGAALTAVRTAAVSALAVRHLTRPGMGRGISGPGTARPGTGRPIEHLVVFGPGRRATRIWPHWPPCVHSRQ